ncbi:PhzF family phenazine biosynthesis protein [Deminuibacter soli]|uniref:PhzF family phenazine biosynthesis protein n=1 Tax=Deminuibacter soli TaxID=2291815 RepID=A0A3E1NJX1_9BACT|nr:PhzF family phenazine biosynthesis protein [Deminuibacter soli]RFM28236.1 PhzF family phenazine biosynthesis protein [Deminuibacter soli]
MDIITRKNATGYHASMNQGKAAFIKTLTLAEAAPILACLGASADDLYPACYPAVVSTGLPYLVLPLRNRAFDIPVGAPGLQALLHAVGAHFLGILDVPNLRIRSGDVDGKVEDAATGSLAGPCGAYLVQQGLQLPDVDFCLHQGENIGRPSKLLVQVRSSGEVMVSGDVCRVAAGVLEEGVADHLNL